MRRDVHLWLPPWILVVLYPGLIYSFAWAAKGYHESTSVPLFAYALLVMLLAFAIPPLALRALNATRGDPSSGPLRAALYVMFALPSLFSLTYTLARLLGFGSRYDVLSEVWVGAWIVVGASLLFPRDKAVVPAANIKWVRITHGVTAALLLVVFLIAHLVNHDLAAWSIPLHQRVMDWLRIWYRADGVEPILLVLFAVMLLTGIPMVAHYARRPMDGFRILQTATGVYIAVFVTSHVLATLTARRLGVETDWFFAAGPKTLLDGTLIGRLIPHYFYAALTLCVHVACGLRIVLLQHGVAGTVSNRVLYGLSAVGFVVTALSFSALLGFHLEP